MNSTGSRFTQRVFDLIDIIEIVSGDIAVKLSTSFHRAKKRSGVMEISVFHARGCSPGVNYSCQKRRYIRLD